MQAVVPMSSLPILLLETGETILDLLSKDDRPPDHSALKEYSLVCQAFLPICRKHIFGSIVLNDNVAASPTTTHALALLLSKSQITFANWITPLKLRTWLAR